MFKSISFFIFLGMLTIIGCTKKTIGSPQEVLSEYVSRSFALKSKEDVSKLKEFATGDVLKELSALEGDAEAFNKYFVDEKNKFLSLRVKDQHNVSADRYSLTYEIAYQTTSEATKDEVTAKKHALFVNEGGKWKIAEVKNLKTFVEHQNEEKISAEK